MPPRGKGPRRASLMDGGGSSCHRRRTRRSRTEFVLDRGLLPALRPRPAVRPTSPDLLWPPLRPLTPSSPPHHQAYCNLDQASCSRRLATAPCSSSLRRLACCSLTKQLAPCTPSPACGFLKHDSVRMHS
jgi:hypothetical protein